MFFIMSKKKTKKRNAGPPKPLVQLSQCMIVKNEEHNIEKALSWGKGIACEQIVVDTGSTDRTVEIAEKMGATVYHFKWINDFSAAKNFAIEQAKGNWIAFLDADEYLVSEDAKHLLFCLKKIQSDAEMRNRWFALNLPWAHVDENGKPFAVQDQERVFRSFVRYIGRIHERIDVSPENIAHVDEMTIIHTGYARGEIDKQQKAERNIQMLRDELKENPNDLNTKVYLADSLQVTNDAQNIAEAEMLFYEAIRGNGGGIIPALKKKSYLRLVSKHEDMPQQLVGREELCKKALLEFPDDLDMTYYLGVALNDKGDHEAALKVLQKCERLLSDKNAAADSEIISANPNLLYDEIARATGEGHP